MNLNFNIDTDRELDVLAKILIDMIADKRISSDVTMEYMGRINEESETILFVNHKL
jgi:hypothetical protein